jgi:Saf4/Yju2 protein
MSLIFCYCCLALRFLFQCSVQILLLLTDSPSYGTFFLTLQTYLGIQIFRFYFKCTKCSAEITFKTDPQNSDYTVESGASRNFEPWRDKDEEAEREKRKRDAEEMGDAMKSLENKALDSKKDMDILAALEEMRSMKVG